MINIVDNVVSVMTGQTDKESLLRNTDKNDRKHSVEKEKKKKVLPLSSIALPLGKGRYVLHFFFIFIINQNYVLEIND